MKSGSEIGTIRRATAHAYNFDIGRIDKDAKLLSEAIKSHTHPDPVAIYIGGPYIPKIGRVPDLEKFAAYPKFVGVRHVTQDEPDDDFIVRPDVIRGLKVLEKHGIPFDLLFYVKHLRHVATLAEELPDQLTVPTPASPEVSRLLAEPFAHATTSSAPVRARSCAASKTTRLCT